MEGRGNEILEALSTVHEPRAARLSKSSLRHYLVEAFGARKHYTQRHRLFVLYSSTLLQFPPHELGCKISAATTRHHQVAPTPRVGSQSRLVQPEPGCDKLPTLACNRDCY